MELWKRIEQALTRIIEKEIPDAKDGIAIDPTTEELFFNTSFFDMDEINLTDLSKLLADAIDIRVDPAPEEAA